MSEKARDDNPTWRAVCAHCGASATGYDGQQWSHWCPRLSTGTAPQFPTIHVERLDR